MSTYRQDLIYKAIKFLNWAAGEGICPIEDWDFKCPEEILLDYSLQTDDEDWDTLAQRIAYG